MRLQCKIVVHQLKCIHWNKKWYINQFPCVNWWTGFNMAIWKNLGVGGVQKFLSLNELRNLYAKMDHPLVQCDKLEKTRGDDRLTWSRSRPWPKGRDLDPRVATLTPRSQPWPIKRKRSRWPSITRITVITKSGDQGRDLDPKVTTLTKGQNDPQTLSQQWQRPGTP